MPPRLTIYNVEPLEAVKNCSFNARSCDTPTNTLLRTSRIGSDVFVDSVVFSRDVEEGVSVDPDRRWPVRGEGAVVCYSGLQTKFGEKNDPMLGNHVRTILRPLARLFRREDLFVAFEEAEREAYARALQVVAEAGIAPQNIFRSTRQVSGPKGLTLDGSNHTVTQKQFLGIEHCGQMIGRLQARRGREFAFALRMRCARRPWQHRLTSDRCAPCTNTPRSRLLHNTPRSPAAQHPALARPRLLFSWRARPILLGRYDVLFSPALHVASWPIWNVSDDRASPVLALSKYFIANITREGLQLHGCPWQLPARRCVPQDVFFVVRNTPLLGPVEAVFQTPRDRRFPSAGLSGRADTPERSMYHHPLSQGAPVDVLWREQGRCLWKLYYPRALFLGRVCWSRDPVRARSEGHTL
eukprot:7389224-Prymnesium_polylepis.2